MQAAAGKTKAKSSPHRAEKTDAVRQQADLDRLRFKMNYTMQLLKDEQKHQEGRWMFISFQCTLYFVELSVCQALLKQMYVCTLVPCQLTYTD